MDEGHPLGPARAIMSTFCLFGLIAALIYAGASGDVSLLAGLGAGWVLRSGCSW